MICYPFKAYLAVENGNRIWIAESLTLDGCSGKGDTVEEAIDKLGWAEREWLQNAVANGVSIPAVPLKESASGKQMPVGAYTLYADGCCLQNPDGPGGWGVIIEAPGQAPVELSGGCASTTSNRMEIMGIIEGLHQIPPGSTVTVISDSQYVIYTMTKGWKRSKNTDLWPILDKLVAERKVTFEWIKGHNGHPQNERCDQLAMEAARIYQ